MSASAWKHSKIGGRTRHEECERHAKKYARRYSANRVIVLTHPFYLPLSHTKLLDSPGDFSAVIHYIHQLMDLLERTPPEFRAGLVLLDTIHYYAAATSLLLERGLIDSVIFTLHDDGHPVRPKDLEQLRGISIYLGGGYYRGGCLSRAISMIRQVAQPDDRLFAIRDLIINTPRAPHLIPTAEDFANGEFSESRVIDSARLIEELHI